MDLQVIKKAFQVYHDGMLSSNPNEGYLLEDIPAILAADANEAKSKATEPYDWNLNGSMPRYIDLRVKRYAEGDRVLYNGVETTRREAEENKREADRVAERVAKINAYPDDAMFYVSHGYHGDIILWNGLNDSGYTTNVVKAQKYTKEEVLKSYVQGPYEHKIWEASHVESNLTKVANNEHLTHSFCS